MTKNALDKMTGKIIITKHGSHTIRADFYSEVLEMLFENLKLNDSQCVFTKQTMTYTGLVKATLDIDKKTYTILIESDEC